MVYATVCRGNDKTKEREADIRDRDAQFRYIQRQGKSFLSRGWPVISVDTKKKRTGGKLRGIPGKNGSRKANLSRSMCTISPTRTSPRRFPRGVYDPELDLGWVTVGCSA